eukprot:CAMPEP_0118940266 /NCGR_PEP_ID=MMETSP1169-20130426/30984_1 /TAXON_ID=36882 /ORGANISM="Pyramimonas obovata, Strain CCMP722" /LENGTH=316 /DNA_ID=CAMNT_0006884711 /DNA_START=128 /DNA_END=1074 /DNA_ORIENTATION=+
MARRQPRRSSPNYCEKLNEAIFVRKTAFHAQPNTIQHWQLRDLVASSETINEVFCVNNKSTLRYNTVTQESSVVQDLSYSPTSMTVGHGFLASGGQGGQLDVFNLRSNSSIFSSTVAENVINSLHIGQTRSADLCLLVSNNDCTVKVYDLPGLTHVTSIDFPVAINYSTLSPDGSCMVCVGDCNPVYLYGTQGGFRLINTFSEASDSGMCCAWNASGTAFATASQDGSVCVWEVRMGKLLAKLVAPRACRAVKFSRSAIDLLCYTEHESAVHVVDARTYDAEQVLQMTPALQAPDLSGIAFCPTGTRLYVGLGDAG